MPGIVHKLAIYGDTRSIWDTSLMIGYEPFTTDIITKQHGIIQISVELQHQL